MAKNEVIAAAHLLKRDEELKGAIFAARMLIDGPSALQTEVVKLWVDKLRERGWVVDLGKQDPRSWFKRPA